MSLPIGPIVVHYSLERERERERIERARERERERERDRWTERERKGIEDAVLYEKGGQNPDRC